MNQTMDAMDTLITDCIGDYGYNGVGDYGWIQTTDTGMYFLFYSCNEKLGPNLWDSLNDFEQITFWRYKNFFY